MQILDLPNPISAHIAKTAINQQNIDGIIILVVVAERYTRGGIRACMEV